MMRRSKLGGVDSCPVSGSLGLLASHHPSLTSGAVREHGHSEVDLRGCEVPGGADGVVPGLQNRELGEQEAGRHPQGRELLQHLQECGAVGELPLVVIRGLKVKCNMSVSGSLLHTEGRGCHNSVFIHSLIHSHSKYFKEPGAVRGAENTKVERSSISLTCVLRTLLSTTGGQQSNIYHNLIWGSVLESYMGSSQIFIII